LKLVLINLFYCYFAFGSNVINEAGIPSRKRLEVFYNSCCAVVFVTNTFLSKAVTPSYTFNSIDKDNVRSIKYEIVYKSRGIGDFRSIF